MARPQPDRVVALKTAIDDRLPSGLKVGRFTLYWHSSRGTAGLDSVADHRVWKRWCDVGIAALVALQVTVLALVAAAASLTLRQSSASALNDPANAVANPGLNAFMPAAAAPYVVAALLVATVVHEAGHALACRAEGVPVEEWGIALFLGVVPVAAYVLPADAFDAASARSKLRVFAVGAFHNLLVAAAAFAVLRSLFAASPTAAYAAYFGWVFVGGTPPTAATVASLGPLTNLCFWVALLNATVALVNALPVATIDGDRVLAISLRSTPAFDGRTLGRPTSTLVVHSASVVTVALVAVAVFAPLMRS
jgi:hypothetical protein